MKIFSRFDLPDSPSFTCSTPSMTDQSQKAQCDIYNIIDSFAYNGALPTVPAAQFTDFDFTVDYQTALNTVIDAQERFESLPSNIRERFNNNPAGLLQFLENEDNRAEAISLGLVDGPSADSLDTDSKE